MKIDVNVDCWPPEPKAVRSNRAGRTIKKASPYDKNRKGFFLSHDSWQKTSSFTARRLVNNVGTRLLPTRHAKCRIIAPAVPIQHLNTGFTPVTSVFGHMRSQESPRPKGKTRANTQCKRSHSRTPVWWPPERCTMNMQ